jgi:predicted transcriptional regulator
MNDIDTERRRLGLSVYALWRLSGVPLSTVQKICAGRAKRPAYATIVRLWQALHNEAARERRDR